MRTVVAIPPHCRATARARPAGFPPACGTPSCVDARIQIRASRPWTVSRHRSSIQGMTNQTLATLVLGGTGKTGRRVVERLRARGVPTRVGPRSGAPPFGWDDRSTWAPALDGVGAVYVSFQPDLAIPGAAEAVGAFA